MISTDTTHPHATELKELKTLYSEQEIVQERRARLREEYDAGLDDLTDDDED